MGQLDVRGLVWPLEGTGADLAGLLAEAGSAARNVFGRGPGTLTASYLQWVAAQERMLRGRIPAADLNRLIATQRYWATLANPNAGANLQSISDELHAQARHLDDAAHAVKSAVEAWEFRDGARFSSIAVVDTNFWIECTDSFSQIEWQTLIPEPVDDAGHQRTSELRLVVPILVVDELDRLTHRRDIRAKAVGAARWLYQLFGDHIGDVVTVAKGAPGRGLVTAQLLFDPPGHTRLPSNDDELVDRADTLGTFLGVSKWRTHFVTYDAGAAFRASAAGLVACLQRRPEA